MITYTKIPATKTMRRFRKSVALFTLACFLLTSVEGQALAALAQEAREQKKFAGIEEGFILPYTLGRITDAHYAAGDRVIIAVQDLHCHAEVQKNIGDIIAFLDKRFHVPRVYQEGAVGQVDTSWLLSVSDRKLRQSIVDSMLEKGELTGAEYYSVVSGRPRLIQGLEEKKPFEDNVLRLNALLEEQPRVERELSRLKEDLPALKKTYYGPGNARLERSLEKYREGATDAAKFYGFLRKYARKNGVDPYAYRNLSSYLDLIETERDLKYPAIARELQGFLALLKERLPYRVYRSLLERSDNFSRLDELYLALAALAGDVALSADIHRRFPELSRFFEYLRLSRQVNPVDLTREERKLVREIQFRLSGSESEREVVFINDHFRLLEEYLTNRISAEDHRYFVQNLPEFRLQWGKHVPGRDLAALDRFFPLLDEYYRVNVERNRYFLRNLSAEAAAKVSPAPAYGDEAVRALALLEQGREAAVVVTGGFHTPGLTELLKENGVSYLVVTPNVTGETAPAELAYSRIMEEQAKMLSATLAPPLLSGAAPFLRERKLVEETLGAELRAKTAEGSLAGRVNGVLKESCASMEGAPGAVFELERLEDNGDCTFFLASGDRRVRFRYAAGEGRVLEGDDRQDRAPKSPAMGKNIDALVRRALAVVRTMLVESVHMAASLDADTRDLMSALERSSLLLGQKYYFLLSGMHGEYLVPEKELGDRERSLLQRIGTKLGALGFSVPADDIRVSRQSRNLVIPESDIFGIGAFTENPVTGRPSVILHQAFFDALDMRGPPAGMSEEDLAELFAEHEGYEYQALNRGDSPAYRAFTAYLQGELKAASARETEEMRTSDNFHRYLRSLAGAAPETASRFTALEQRLAAQSALLEFAEDAALLEDMLRSFGRTSPDSSGAVVRDALALAARTYAGKRFPSGESYLRHALTVARNVARWGADDATIAAALLHKLSFEQLNESFARENIARYPSLGMTVGERIVAMAGKLARISKLPYVDGTITGLREGSTLDNYMKMVVEMAGDDQMMLLVFADKLQTFGESVAGDEKDYRRQEIEHIYVPLAMRLDAYDIAEDLRNGAFRLNNEQEYARIRDEVEKTLKITYYEAERYLESLKKELTQRLEERGVRGPVVKVRVKTPYSVWEKISSSRREGYDSLEQLKDIMGIHIVVEDRYVDRSVKVVSEWLNNNRNFRPAGDGSRIEHADNKGLSRYKFNYSDTDRRPYELCIFGAKDYSVLQSGFIDETAVKSPKPHWIYKLGRASGVENCVFTQVITFNPQAPGMPVREVNQSFKTDNIRYAGHFRLNFEALKATLRNRIFVMFIDEQGRLGVVRLPEGSIPVDVVAHTDVDLLNRDYRGVEKVFLVKHGENPVREEKPRVYVKEKKHTLRNGDMIALARNIPGAFFPSVTAIRNAKTPRAQVFALLMSQDRVSPLEDLVQAGRQSLARGGRFEPDRDTIAALDNFRRSKGLKNLDELYLALALGVLENDEVWKYLRLTTRRVVEIVAEDTAGLLAGLVTGLANLNINVLSSSRSGGGDLVTYRLTVEDAELAGQPADDPLLEEALKEIEGVRSVDVQRARPLYWSARSLGENVRELLVGLFGIDTVMDASVSLQSLLARAFEKELVGPREAQRKGYLPDVKAMEEGVAERLRTGAQQVEVRISRNPELIKKDAWALATLDITPEAGARAGERVVRKAVLYVHEEVLRALKGRAPPDRARLLRLLVEHETDEYRALNEPGSDVYESFGNYLAQERDIPLTEIPAERTAENFHQYLAHLSAHGAEGDTLSPGEARCREQIRLFSLANAILASRAGKDGMPADERHLLGEIFKELLEPGTGKLPWYGVLTDVHAGHHRLVGLLSSLLGKDLDPSKTLAEQGITRESVPDFEALLILGDLLDRGPEGMKVIRLVQELVENGMAQYVVGNHDLWAFMNLLGLHLPWYAGYRGIPADYTGYGLKEYGGNVVRLLDAKRAANPFQVNDINLWAQKLSQYMAFADQNQSKQWKPLEARFEQIFNEMYGYNLAEKDVLNKPEGLFSEDKELKKWWGLVMGHNVGIKVYTGVRAAGKMSINWWTDRRRELDALAAKYPSPLWEEVAGTLDGIIAFQKAKMDEELAAGNWEWAVIDAMMYRNYESGEWWSLDWVYHKGWGGLKEGLLSEINADLKARGAAPEDLLNEANYLRNPDLQKLRAFYMKNFRLYRRDRYGNVYMHTFPPVDDDGDVSIGRIRDDGVLEQFEKDGTRIKGFYYKGVHYAGADLFRGFDRLADDISSFEFGTDPLAEIYEALALVNSIYADLSTRVKPADLKRYKAIGFGKILDRMGVNRLICGHNPVSKLNKSGVETAERESAGGRVRLIHIDDDMSPGYTPPLGKGSSLVFSAQGSVMSGYVSGEPDAGQVPAVLIAREEFLLTVLDELLASLGPKAGREALGRLLAGLKRPLSGGLVAALGAGLVRYLSGQAAQDVGPADGELARALREAPATGEAGWEEAYARLAAKLLTGEKERRLYEKVDRYYRTVDFDAVRARNREIARGVNAAPGVQEVYGVGFPHYGNVDIRLRNYETLKAVEQGRIPLREFPQRMLPDIDFLVVIDESDEGPWSVQVDMDERMMDGFVQQAGMFQRPWRRVFDDLVARFPLINKFNGEGSRNPIDLFLEQDKLNIDFVPVARHIWNNIPVFVRAGDRASFKFIRDLMFTAAPLSRRDGEPSHDIPLQFRRNFLLNLLDEQGPVRSENELFDRVIAGHPYRFLIELYPEIQRSVESIFAEALNDAREKGLVQERGGMLSLTPRGRKFLLYVLEHRRRILDEGYFDLPPYNEGIIATLSNAPEERAGTPLRDAIGKVVELLPVSLDAKGALQGIIRNIDGGGAADVSDVPQRAATDAEVEGLIAAAEELARTTPMSDAERKALANVFGFLRQKPPRVILTEGSPADFFGMGREGFIVLNREIASNPVAFLHEALEYLKYHRPLLLTVVESSLNGASRQWLEEKEQKYETLSRHAALVRPHYVIRAFTRQVFGDRDEELTEQIRARSTVPRQAGTAPRSAARTAADREKEKIARITRDMMEHTGVRSLREGLRGLIDMDVRTPEAREFAAAELARLMVKLQNNVNRDDYFNLRYAVEVVSDMFSDSPFIVPREYENTDRAKFNALLDSLVRRTGRGALTPAEQEEAERFCRALDEIRPALAAVAADARYPNLCGPSAQIISDVLGRKYGFPAQKYVFTGFGFAQTCVETEVAGFRFYVDGTAGLIINDDGRRIAPVVTPLLDVEEKNIVTYREAAGMKKRRVDGFVSMVEIDRETADLVREVKEARLAAEKRAAAPARGAVAPSVPRTLEEVLRVADPRRAFTGELPAVAAAGLAPERHARMKDEAPELYGKTVLRYYDELSARDMDEMAALKDLGVNVIAVLPYLPSDELSGRDNIILERGGERTVAGVREGRVAGEDGRSFGVLCIEGVRPGETVQVARWLKESPALHRKLQSLLGLEFADLDPAVVEIKTARPAEEALGGMPARSSSDAALLYRPALERRAADEAARALPSSLDGIVDERTRYGLDAAASAEKTAFETYLPQVLRRNAVSVSRAGTSLGETVMVSALRGADARRDAGIGELRDLAGYLAGTLSQAGMSVMQLTPLTLPEGESPFEPADPRAGDYALVTLSAVPEVEALLASKAVGAADLAAPADETDAVRRERVQARKFAVLDKARVSLFGKKDGRFDRFNAYAAAQAPWLDAYAERMAAAKVLGTAPSGTGAAQVAEARQKDGALFAGYADTFRYMQWLFDGQLREAVAAVHDNGGKLYFWLETGADGLDAAPQLLTYWFGYGFDGVRVNLRDAQSASGEQLQALRAAVSRAKPDALVSVSTDGDAGGPSLDALAGALDFLRVRAYSEIAAGGRVSAGDVVEMDRPRASARPHKAPGLAAPEDLKDFYRERIERVQEASGVLFMIGNLWGDDVPLSAPDRSGAARWSYRVPSEGEVREERVKSSLAGFARELLDFSASNQRASFRQGYEAAAALFKDVVPDPGEAAALRQERSFEVRGKDGQVLRRVAGPGLHAALAVRRFLLAAPSLEKEITDYHTQNGPSFFSLVLPLLDELAGRPGARRKYWQAAAAHVGSLERRARAGDEAERSRAVSEMFGFVRGLLEQTLENAHRTDNLPLADAGDRAAQKALLLAADSFLSPAGGQTAAAPSEQIRLLLSLHRFAEAGVAFEELARTMPSGAAQGYADAKSSLEFAELLNRYAAQTGDTAFVSRMAGALRTAIGRCPVNGEGLVTVDGASPVELQALYYNALRVLSAAETGPAKEEAARQAEALKAAVARNYAPESLTGSGALYLLGLSEAGDLLSPERKQALLKHIEEDLLGLDGIRRGPQEKAYEPGLIGLYADALVAVRLEQARAKGAKTDRGAVLGEAAPELRRLINPLLERLLRNGGLPESLPLDETQELSSALPIAELYRIFDLLAKPQIPALADPARAFEGAVRMMDIRSAKAMKGAA